MSWAGERQLAVERSKKFFGLNGGAPASIAEAAMNFRCPKEMLDVNGYSAADFWEEARAWRCFSRSAFWASSLFFSSASFRLVAWSF